MEFKYLLYTKLGEDWERYYNKLNRFVKRSEQANGAITRTMGVEEARNILTLIQEILANETID